MCVIIATIMFKCSSVQCHDLFIEFLSRSFCAREWCDKDGWIDGADTYIRGGARILKGRGLRFHIDASCMCIVPYAT